MDHSQAAVVILNYNGASFLEQFLPSVLKHSGDARIIVADNASTDHSLKVLDEQFAQEVEVIRLCQNYGFCGGYNRALKQVDAPFYVLLNSDIEVTAGWLAPILSLFEAQPQLAACQPKVLAQTQPDRFEHAGAGGGGIDSLGYPFCRGRIFDDLEEDQGQYDDECAVFWATGACLVIRSQCYWDMGGLEEGFFAHMEEVDLCWRLQRAGYTIGYSGKSTVYHVGGGTLQTDSPFKIYLNFRNGLLLLLKNLPPKARWQVLFLRMVFDGVAAWRFLLMGKPQFFRAIFRAHLGFYRMLPEYWPKRNRDNRTSLPSIYPKSIAVQYFLKGKRKFSQLGWKFPQLSERYSPSKTKSS